MPAFKGKFIPYNLKNNTDVTADPSTYLISWERDVDKVIEQMRGNREMCFWLFDNVMECIAGTGPWKIDVRTGNKSPSEVTTPSAEGLFWVLMKNHWKDWEHTLPIVCLSVLHPACKHSLVEARRLPATDNRQTQKIGGM